MNRDIEYGIKQVACICQNASAAAISGVEVDRAGFESAVFSIIRGEEAGSPSAWTLDMKIQERDSGESWADVTGAAITQLTEDSETLAISLIKLGLVGRKRYLKAVATLAMTGGSTPTLPITVVCMLGNAREVPVTQSVTAVRIGDVASV